MGLNAKDADIDTIVIAPSWVDRDYHFFTTLPLLLRSNPGIECLYAVQDSSVPLLRFKFHGTPLHEFKESSSIWCSPPFDTHATHSLTRLPWMRSRNGL
jgi:poly(A) polymerase Pap1